MATSEAEVCNLALAACGSGQFIDDLDDPSTEGILCKRFYATTRDALLSRFPWPFATRRNTLSLLTVTRDGWKYAYALPTDCLEAQYIYAGVRPDAPYLSPGILDRLDTGTSAIVPAGAPPQIPFAVEASDDATSRILLTDQDQAELVYTAQILAVPAFPALFVDALGAAVAAVIAMPLTKQRALAVTLKQEAELVISRAWANALNSQQQDVAPDAAAIAVRG